MVGTKTTGTTALSRHAPLDSLHPDIPVVLQRIDGHAVLANRAALKASSMWRSARCLVAKCSAGGWYAQRCVDRRAADFARIPKPGRAEKQQALARRAKPAGMRFDHGHRRWIGLGRHPAPGFVAPNRRLKLRVVAMANPHGPTWTPWWPTEACARKSCGESFKFYMDGALGSRVRRCSTVDDRPGHRGLLLQDPDSQGAVD